MKAILFFALGLVILVSSCKKDKPEDDQTVNNGGQSQGPMLHLNTSLTVHKLV